MTVLIAIADKCQSDRAFLCLPQSSKELIFENRLYQGPSDYEAVLCSIYGPDYMQLPPLDKRKTHYPVKVIFIDGEVMEFHEND